MKVFSQPVYRLTAASPNLRLVLGLYLVFVLFGLAINMVMTYRETGFSLEGIETYYRGSAKADGETIVYPKSASELIFNTHFHLFMMPLVFLVLCHIFYMTATPEWLKRGLTWTVFLAALGEIGAPWLVRFVSAKFAILMALSGSFMGMGMLVLIAVPLYELWFLPPAPAPTATDSRLR